MRTLPLIRIYEKTRYQVTVLFQGSETQCV